MWLWNMVFEQSEVSVPEDQLFSPAPPFWLPIQPLPTSTMSK